MTHASHTANPLLTAFVGSLLFMSALQAQAPQGRSVPELEAFYRQNCVRCHGLDGSAHSLDGKKLGGADFTALAKALKAQGDPATDREVRTMVKTIQKGLLFGLSMPSWKHQLSEEESLRMIREVLLKAEPGKVIGGGAVPQS